ncbi:MAG: BlaI/MecI/CopY family transcriptional regulator [Clostridia bacterium]|nr:BlaI/MecI/CopY family transcriptional regulator [Clostridia bacterium]MBQ8513660.1 BlaI/MecI/CopY family transcriptional regulator [Clostridia bacterium]
MEERKIIKLPESELEIMQGIWVLNEEGEKFVSASLVMKRFPALQRLKLTTVLTLITRLQTKGFIKTEKLGRSNCYTPIISSADYRKFATGDYVKKVYLGDKMDLISALVSDETLTQAELDEIKAIIAKNEENK